MTKDERAEYVQKFLDTFCFPVMGTKGEEYSRGEEDCNSNFKRVAEATGLTPLQVAYVYLAKHLDSIASYVKRGQVFSDEGIEGRLGDAINYLLILGSLIEEASA